VSKIPNWFEETPHAKKNFEEFLLPMAGKENLKFLQLGAFTGDASVWMLDNVLTGKGSELHDVDLFIETPELAFLKLEWGGIENTYLERTSKYTNVTLYKQHTHVFLKTAPLDYYDFIYVDACPEAVDVLIEAELSWFSLKVGGIIAFDDYEFGMERVNHLKTPKRGVETFHSRRREKLSLVNVPTHQVWLKKESN